MQVVGSYGKDLLRNARVHRKVSRLWDGWKVSGMNGLKKPLYHLVKFVGLLPRNRNLDFRSGEL